MQLILNNPYRVIGLLVGATAREQDRRIKNLELHLESEQQPEIDYSFPILGELERSVQDVDNAASKLNHGFEKIKASLFWFFDGNSITDGPALEALGNHDITSAIEIWRKLIGDGEDITRENASAFHNLSTLYLSEYGIDEDTLNLKLRFLESEYVDLLVDSATDSTIRISGKYLQLRFLNEIVRQEQFEISEIIAATSDIEFMAKEDFLKGLGQKLIDKMERLILKAQTKRRANKANAASLGNTLFKQMAESLMQLKSVLGTSDIKYTSVSDKVADEILQCGIDYFIYHHGSNTDLGLWTIDLFQKAKSLAYRNVTKQRINENIAGLYKWIAEKPQRAKLRSVKEEIDFIKAILDPFNLEIRLSGLAYSHIWLQEREKKNLERRKDKINSFLACTKKMLLDCKPKLVNIKEALTIDDKIYLLLSDNIVKVALNELIECINCTQEDYNKDLERDTNKNSFGFGNFQAFTLREILRETLTETWNIIGFLGTLDMSNEVKQHYFKNKSTLKEICQRFLIDTRTPKELFESELITELRKMEKIKEWQFLRSEADRNNQIQIQQTVIDELKAKVHHAEF